MDQDESVSHQFKALRHEILARQIRIYWTVVIGLLGMPALTFFASDAHTLSMLALPFLVLVIIILFLTEQNAMMRCGRYIREHIEPKLSVDPCWEAWLESRPEYRMMEKNFVGSFIVVFFLYYFLSIATALYKLWEDVNADPSGHATYWLYGALVAYAIGAIWGVVNLFSHFRQSVSTAHNPGN